MNNQNTTIVSVIVDHENALTTQQLCEVLCLQQDYVNQLVAHGILSAIKNNNEWLFDGNHISRTKKAVRLQQDFNASFTALALIMDLMDEIEQLRSY